MLGFFIGLFIGGFIGVAVMAMLNVASESDRHIEEDYNNAET